MTTRVLLEIASTSILKNKLRTLLTMLGIVIGVSAVIVMIAVGNGASSTIQNQIKALGTNMIVLTPGAAQIGGASQGAGTFTRLSVDDAEKLKREGVSFAGVSPVIFTRTQAIGGAGNWRTEVQGVAPEYQTIRDWTLADGAFFTEADLRSMRKVAVLGSTVAQASSSSARSW
jgi:putative ABC transport system permease protein